jgi:diaminopimelate decarboxylase
MLRRESGRLFMEDVAVEDLVARYLATVERAVAIGARITIDDVREIDLARRAAQTTGKRAVVRLRLRPHVDTDAKMEATGIPIVDVYGKYKSGIPRDDLAEAGKALSMPELDVSGVMMHMGRYTTDLDVIGQFSRRFGELIAEVSDLWGGWTPTSIDIGGGFAPPVDGFGRARPDYTGPPPAPEIEQYAETICDNLTRGLATGGLSTEGRSLEVEPGRSLFAPCGIHVTTALNVKRQTKPFPFTWIDTDTSVAFLSDIPVSSARPPVVLVNEPQRALERIEEVRIVGHSCQADVLAHSAFLPPLAREDLLAFCFTGAYHEVGSSNFNVMPRPGTVLVRKPPSCAARKPSTMSSLATPFPTT